MFLRQFSFGKGGKVNLHMYVEHSIPESLIHFTYNGSF